MKCSTGSARGGEALKSPTAALDIAKASGHALKKHN